MQGVKRHSTMSAKTVSRQLMVCAGLRAVREDWVRVTWASLGPNLPWRQGSVQNTAQLRKVPIRMGQAPVPMWAGAALGQLLKRWQIKTARKPRSMLQSISVNAPEFFVLGAAQSGLARLRGWLDAHPDVFLPEVAEPGFFAFSGGGGLQPRSGPLADRAEALTDLSSYEDLYRGTEGELRGDMSSVYLFDPHAAIRIAALRPDARLVVVLRDPVRRAYAHYSHNRAAGIEELDRFEDALGKEIERSKKGWGWQYRYLAIGRYREQVQRYLEIFPQSQIVFLSAEALERLPGLCWQRVCLHLGLRYTALSTAQRAVPDGASMTGELGLSFATRSVLARAYIDERPALEAMTGLSLSSWVAP